MWDTLKAARESINEAKKARTRSQARRKRKKSKKGVNLMTKKENDVNSVSFCTSLNAENYSQLLQDFKETHEEANLLALVNNRLRGLKVIYSNRLKVLIFWKSRILFLILMVIMLLVLCVLVVFFYHSCWKIIGTDV